MEVEDKRSQKVVLILSKILYKRLRKSSKSMASAASSRDSNSNSSNISIEFKTVNIKIKPPIELNRLALKVQRPKFTLDNITSTIVETNLNDLILSIQTFADHFIIHLKTTDAKRLLMFKNPTMFADILNGKKEFVVKFVGIPVEYGSVRVAEFANHCGDFFRINRVKHEENGLSVWTGEWTVTYSKIWVELPKQVVLDGFYAVKLFFDEREAKEMFRIYQEEITPVSSDSEYEYFTEYETNGKAMKRRNKKRVKRITTRSTNSLLKGLDGKKTLNSATSIKVSLVSKNTDGNKKS